MKEWLKKNTWIIVLLLCVYISIDKVEKQARWADTQAAAANQRAAALEEKMKAQEKFNVMVANAFMSSAPSAPPSSPQGYTTPVPRRTCPTCRGSGRSKEIMGLPGPPCTTCGGSGLLFK